MNDITDLEALNKSLEGLVLNTVESGKIQGIIKDKYPMLYEALEAYREEMVRITSRVPKYVWDNIKQGQAKPIQDPTKRGLLDEHYYQNDFLISAQDKVFDTLQCGTALILIEHEFRYYAFNAQAVTMARMTEGISITTPLRDGTDSAIICSIPLDELLEFMKRVLVNGLYPKIIMAEMYWNGCLNPDIRAYVRNDNSGDTQGLRFAYLNLNDYDNGQLVKEGVTTVTGTSPIEVVKNNRLDTNPLDNGQFDQ
jgi:hypothetical protein